VTLDDVTVDALGYGADWGAQAYAYAARLCIEADKREARRDPRPRPSRAVGIGHPITLSQKREITRWLRRGKPVSEVARKVGVSTGVVMLWRSKAVVPKREWER